MSWRLSQDHHSALALDLVTVLFRLCVAAGFRLGSVALFYKCPSFFPSGMNGTPLIVQKNPDTSCPTIASKTHSCYHFSSQRRAAALARWPF